MPALIEETKVSNPAFSELDLKAQLLHNLDELGYAAMTPVQAQSLPAILGGSDLIAQAQTGSGKTAAFGLGLLNKLDERNFRVQCLVLCPTRELADQVARELRQLARAIPNIKVLSLCGGVPLGPQVGSLRHGAHIVVGTPGRIEEHLRKGTLQTADISTLVLDEADRMLDMGFQDSLDAIIEKIPRQRQTLLLSATYPDAIEAIAGRVMRDPVMIKVAPGPGLGRIREYFYRLPGQQSRDGAVCRLLLHFRPQSALVFCNTKQETRELTAQLAAFGFSALALHGDLEQRERNQTLAQFANNSATVLVATDVAARGLDIDALDLVINHRPARTAELHLHRIGRTGRAGASGIACTIFDEREAFKLDQYRVREPDSAAETELPPLALLQQPAYGAPMRTLQISGGRRQKLRPGDILGALTAGEGIDGALVGKIDLSDHFSYVAIKATAVPTALRKLRQGKLKGRSFKVREL
jgi:ATP-independent RNA helicase DbpA